MSFFQTIYALPILHLSLLMILLLGFWLIINYYLQKKNKEKFIFAINVILLILGLAFILRLTVFHRNATDSIIHWNPFNLVLESKVQPEYWRSMFMNVILFIPASIALPFVLHSIRGFHREVMVSLISMLLLSVFVEALQYFLSNGQAETADVVCNFLGAVIGMIPFMVISSRKHIKNF